MHEDARAVRAAKRLATTRPTPSVDPVINTVLPASFMISFLSESSTLPIIHRVRARRKPTMHDDNADLPAPRAASFDRELGP